VWKKGAGGWQWISHANLDSLRLDVSMHWTEFPVDDRRSCAGEFRVDSAKRSC
jgi:hypothetical protein